MNRPSFDEMFLRITETLATRSSCPRRGTGSVIVDVQNRIVGTGYNGTPSGLPHCVDVGCREEDNHCTRAVHAELNAVLNSADLLRARGGTIYVWGAVPCYRCAQAIVALGITKVVASNTNYDNYKYPEEPGSALLREAGVVIEIVDYA